MTLFDTGKQLRDQDKYSWVDSLLHNMTECDFVIVDRTMGQEDMKLKLLFSAIDPRIEVFFLTGVRTALLNLRRAPPFGLSARDRDCQ